MISVKAKPVLRLEGPSGSIGAANTPTDPPMLLVKSRNCAVLAWLRLWLLTAKPTSRFAESATVIEPSAAQFCPSKLANPVNVSPARCNRNQPLGKFAGNEPLTFAAAPIVSRYSKNVPATLGVVIVLAERLAGSSVSRAIKPAFDPASANLNPPTRAP